MDGVDAMFIRTTGEEIAQSFFSEFLSSGGEGSVTRRLVLVLERLKPSIVDQRPVFVPRVMCYDPVSFDTSQNLLGPNVVAVITTHQSVG